VAARTKGDLQILVFHSAQLGVEEDIIEQLRRGIPVGQNTDAARMGNYIREMAVINAPYFLQDPAQVERLSKTPSVQRWIDQLASQYGIRVLCMNWVQGARHFMTNRPIRTPQDLRGLRIRTPPAPIWQESVRALGATPVALAFGEIYSGLQQRAIDGVELVYQNILDMSLNEVLRYVNETQHILLVNFQVVGKAWFQRLPRNYQQILVEECESAGRGVTLDIQVQTAKAQREVQRRGMTIVTNTNLEAFRQAGQTAYERLGLLDARRRLYEEMGLR
jgi:TRAP-type C4-dicarboxylate transport system substrate-binding protein